MHDNVSGPGPIPDGGGGPQGVPPQIRMLLEGLHSLLSQGSGGFNIRCPVALPQDDGSTVPGEITPIQALVNLACAVTTLATLVDEQTEILAEVAELLDEQLDMAGEDEDEPRAKRRKTKTRNGRGR